MLAYLHPSASPVWLPTGLALAVLLIMGLRYWPAILLGAFLVNATTEGTVTTSATIAIGNTAEAIVATVLVHRFAGGVNAFRKVSTSLRFMLFAGLLCPILSSTIGVSSLILAGSVSANDALSVWVTWWLGNMVSAVTIAPLLIMWCENPRISWSTNKSAEAGAMLAFLGALGIFVFETSNYPYPYITLLPLILASVRFSPRETTTSLVLLCSIAVHGTLMGYGPFGNLEPNTSLLFLQAFIAVASFIGLTLGASLEERKTFELSLENKVNERTHELMLAREQDRANFLRLRNIIEQMTMATVAADEHMMVLHSNESFRKLFHPDSSTATSLSLPAVFADSPDVFHDPLASADEFLQLLLSRQQTMNREFILKSGRILSCDYTPIFDVGIHRGHLLLFRDVTTERSINNVKTKILSHV